MPIVLFELGTFDAGTASIGGHAHLQPGGPVIIQASETGSYDETVTIQGSIDGVTWTTLGTLATGGASLAITAPWPLIRANQLTGSGTDGQLLAVKAARID